MIAAASRASLPPELALGVDDLGAALASAWAWMAMAAAWSAAGPRS